MSTTIARVVTTHAAAPVTGKSLSPGRGVVPGRGGAGLWRSWTGAVITDQLAGPTGSTALTAWHEHWAWPALGRIAKSHYNITNCRDGHVPAGAGQIWKPFAPVGLASSSLKPAAVCERMCLRPSPQGCLIGWPASCSTLGRAGDQCAGAGWWSSGGARLTLTFDLSMAPRFGLEVSPALVTFGEMLMMPYVAMQSVIDDELSANPALERLDPGECPVCAGGRRSRCPVCSMSGRRGGQTSLLNDGLARPTQESDVESLRSAVRIETNARDESIVNYLVDSLDEHGLLDRSVAELAAELHVDECRVAQVLGVIRRVGPPGLGAENVAQCLLLQLDALHLPKDQHDVARHVIKDHLPALALGHFAAIAALLKVSQRDVRQVLDLIRRSLRPYPAFDGAAADPVRYAVPDVVVRRDGLTGTFLVDLVEPAFTRIRIRPPSRGQDTAIARSIGDQRPGTEAKLFLAQLNDRWTTLRRVVEFVVARQHRFLLDGPGALVPLTRAEVANALDLHESTVSRAVADKFALLPDDTLWALKAFFGCAGGIDDHLRRVIMAAGRPLSDQQIADKLGAEGFSIARRTVAKRRAKLGFSSSPLR